MNEYECENCGKSIGIFDAVTKVIEIEDKREFIFYCKKCYDRLYGAKYL